MTPEEFLQQLNPHSRVFDLSVDYKYTEEQLVLFAKLYHESELKKLRVTDVSVSVCNHPLPYRLAKSDVNYECTLCGKFI
jgi:hypothetical protein